MPYADPFQRKAFAAAYHKANRERIVTYLKNYRCTHELVIRQKNLSLTRRFHTARTVAKRRKIGFDLTREQYELLVVQPCYYCEEITLGVETGGGLDRIDNQKGYTFDNVVQCCGDCNYHRRTSWTVEEMKVAVMAIKHLRGTK